MKRCWYAQHQEYLKVNTDSFLLKTNKIRRIIFVSKNSDSVREAEFFFFSLTVMRVYYILLGRKVMTKRQFLPIRICDRPARIFIDDILLVHTRVKKARPLLPKYCEHGTAKAVPTSSQNVGCKGLQENSQQNI